jgi:hypothetical protein
MARYTLKTFCGAKSLEVFEHRNSFKLKNILDQPRHHRPGETDAWGTPLNTVDRFEIFDSMREKVFEGNVAEAIAFVAKLK